MAAVIRSPKSCTVNPLKMSQPIGAALAFLGIDKSIPVLHGSQGCTSFGLVLFVRHFREAIPMQTTAMNEVTTILGGEENIEQAILTLHEKARPAVIGLCTTGLTETKGEDITGAVKLIRDRHPELADTAIIPLSTPDFVGAFEDGWGKAVTALVEQLAEGESVLLSGRVNVLTGPHTTPADAEELREIIEAFGLKPILLPDLAGSLDGHVPDEFSPTTLGGTPLAAIRSLGRAELTIAVGERMRPAAEALRAKCGVPYEVFDTLTGLDASDRLMDLLYRTSMEDIPARFRRQRSRLVDAMLDGHFHIGGRRVAIGAEPDLLYAQSRLFADMGARVEAAVTTTHSPVLARVPADEVLIGDLEDLEARAAGCDLIVTHSHGRQMAERLQIPLLRVGIPTFDRLGAGHRLSVGYRGTMGLIFEAANAFLEHRPVNRPDTWAESPAEGSVAVPVGPACTQGR